MSSDDFLSRWSRRKHEARKADPVAEAGSEAPAAAAVPAQPGIQSPAPIPPPEPLPPVESLTTESDFAPFMKTEVDPGVRRQALKVLMRDPRFNVMDRLDTYIDDYSQPDPLPEGWLEQLNQMKALTHGIEEPKVPAERENGVESPAPEPPEALQKEIPEQAVELPPPDTSEGAKPGTEVGEFEPPAR